MKKFVARIRHHMENLGYGTIMTPVRLSNIGLSLSTNQDAGSVSISLIM